MQELTKVLLLEDNVNDAELVKRQILRGGHDFEIKHAINYQSFTEFLVDFNPDIILSDYNLLTHTAYDALRFTKEVSPNTPFIIVTGSIDEETAAQTIKEGAWDYIVKERLARLNSAITNALKLKNEKQSKLQALEELRISEERYALAVDGSLDGIWDWDVRTNYTYRSPRFLEILGFERNIDLSDNRIWEDLLHSDDKSRIVDLLHEHIKGGSSNFQEEFRLLCENGKYKWVQGRGKALFENEKAIRMVGSMTDITKKKENEFELILAKERAEESDKLKTAFLANMSHEIRTPMNAILGFSEILLKDGLTPLEKKDYGAFIKINGDSLLKIIDDIIDISKIQSDTLIIRKANFDLQNVFNELEVYYHAVLLQKEKKDLQLVFEFNESDHITINSDETRIKQVLNNLISNAIKYSEKGKIEVAFTIKNSEIIFSVTDTGEGIPLKNQAKIFGRFMQFSNKFISRQEGTGLGLPISKELVSLLGGELKVNSTVGKGSVFFFNIPLVRVNNENTEPKPILIDNFDFSKKSVLIVDDEEANYVLLKRQLKESKIKTEWAANGKQAIEMASNNKYDLILMDIKMPVMDGIEATRILKDKEVKTPIIIQTAFAMSKAKEQAQKAGCDGFLVKPIKLDSFLTIIKQNL